MKLNISQNDLQINDQKKINFYSDISIDNYKYLKKNYKSILTNVVNYFKNNTNKFIILKKLYDDKIDYELTLDIIDYYCKNNRNDWYRSICRKYNLRFGDRPILSPYKYSEILELHYKDHVVKLTLSNLIFFKHFFEDKIYDEINAKIKEIDEKLKLKSDEEEYVLLSTDDKGYKIRGYYKNKNDAINNYEKIKKLENLDKLYVLKNNLLKKPISENIKYTKEIFEEKENKDVGKNYCQLFLLFFKVMLFCFLLLTFTILVEKDDLFSNPYIKSLNDQIKKYLL